MLEKIQHKLQQLKSDGFKTYGFNQELGQRALFCYSDKENAKVAFQAEYDLLECLEGKGFVKPMAIATTEHQVSMTFVAEEGILLSQYIQNQSPSIDTFLELAIQLSDILGELIQKGIIHQHIAPENFLYNDTTKLVQLFDCQYAYNIAANSPKKEQPLNDLRFLNYISPEQSGRINRKIDYRTSIYSLGILLYQMLTQQIPFKSEDFAGLIHAHLAKTPISPKDLRPDVPLVLSSILLKMMNKAPELRYQSAIGLKADLVHCLSQYQRNQQIPPFKLGEKEVSGIFEVPKKLYGRDKEIKVLNQAWEAAEKGSANLMMVAGFSGIGKSALIEQLSSKVTQSGAFFVQGKFDQFNRDSPYAAGIEAFRQLIRQILSKSDADIAYWKERFNKAIGENVGVIIEVIPELELITGTATKVLPLPPAESLNRFNLAFLQFFQAIAAPKHPLFLFLDDLQWVDIPSLKLIELVMTDKETNSLLLVGAYRDNEVDESHPLQLSLSALEEQKIKYAEINLGQLKYEDLNQFIADTLKETQNNTQALAELVLKKTDGNPFFTTAFLKSLYQEKLLQFSYKTARWNWDISKIEAQNITENVVDLMTKKIKLLDKNTQDLLKLAACIGNTFDLETLSIVHNHSLEDTVKDLEPALLEELVLVRQKRRIVTKLAKADSNTIKSTYRFLHDRVQQAAYSLIEKDARQKVHLQIARQLKASLSPAEQKDRIFDLVGQFNSGKEAITALEEKVYVTQLNLEAGDKAKLSAAYNPAFRYYSQGIELLPKSAWTNYYDLALKLYSEGAEAAYLSNNIEEMEALTAIVFRNSRKDLDKIKAYTIRIQAYVSITQNEKALQESLEALKMLGIHFPKKPGQFHIIRDLIKTKIKLVGKGNQQLLNLPEMTDKRMAAVMEILSYAMSPSYFASPNLFPLLVFKQINLSNKYGNHLHTGFAYSTYGLILCGSTNEFDKGQEYGDLALQLKERFNARVLGAKIPYIRAHFIRHWKEPYANTHEESKGSMHQGFNIGDFLYGAYAIFHHITTSLYMGKSLPETKKLMDSYVIPLAKTKQELVSNWLNIYRQTVANLMDETQISGQLIGAELDETITLPLLESGKDYSGMGVFRLEKLMLNYILGFNDVALENGTEAIALLPNLLGTPHPPIITFYYALSLAKSANKHNEDGKPKRLIKQVKQQLKKIKPWAKSCPQNQAHRLALVTAEWYRLQGKKKAALAEYQNAIAAAKANGYTQVLAIAYELLANFHQAQNEQELSRKYLLEARQTFANWGARAKVHQMDAFYPQLANRTANSTTLLTPLGLADSATKHSENIDMLSLTKASLAIAGEIQLDKLTDKLMEVVIENAGAQQGALIIHKKEQWVVAAEAEVKTKERLSGKDRSIQEHDSIPESIVQYVIRTKEHLVLDDVQKDNRFSEKELIKARKIRSVSCLPIINQGNLTGILYLENNLQPEVFTAQRVQFLTLLSGQIAISLENALLYQNLEQKVEERTLEIKEEKNKSDQLLLNILPAETAQELKLDGVSQPRSFEHVTILFTDFVNFSQFCATLSAEELVSTIHHYYSFFDALMEKYGLEKIKTIGDSYMCVGGLPEPKETHAIDIIKAAQEIRAFVIAEKANPTSPAKIAFDCRLGIHSGSVITGIVGTKKFAYDIWGDAVNIAARLETNSQANKINISAATYELIANQFSCEYRGEIAIKNRGEIGMYFVD